MSTSNTADWRAWARNATGGKSSHLTEKAFYSWAGSCRDIQCYQRSFCIIVEDSHLGEPFERRHESLSETNVLHYFVHTINIWKLIIKCVYTYISCICLQRSKILRGINQKCKLSKSLISCKNMHLKTPKQEKKYIYPCHPRIWEFITGLTAVNTWYSRLLRSAPYLCSPYSI